MADLVQLPAHENMTVQECLEMSAREHADLDDVIVAGYNKDGELVIRSSHMSRKDAAWLLMAALDHARGKLDG